MSKCVIDGGTLYGHRRLLVSWKMTDRRLVDPATRVDVDCIDDLVSWSLSLHLVLNLILAGWCEQETAVGREGQAPEE